jgi:hypothetical protein
MQPMIAILTAIAILNAFLAAMVANEIRTLFHDLAPRELQAATALFALLSLIAIGCGGVAWAMLEPLTHAAI